MTRRENSHVNARNFTLTQTQVMARRGEEFQPEAKKKCLRSSAAVVIVVNGKRLVFAAHRVLTVIRWMATVRLA